MRAEHFCSACGKVQPPVPVDYFTFFGLPRKLNVDVPALEREFYQLSRKLHPDLYSGADAREQEWSLEQSSQLNDAYRTLIRSSAPSICCDLKAWNSKSNQRPRPTRRAPPGR
jgi:molecular chaperone HscB